MKTKTLQLTVNPEYEKLVPELSDFDYNKLKQSIKQEGLREKIIVNQDYVILDGHHRYGFCQEFAIPITEDNIDIRDFDNKQKEIEYVFNTNLERRHYNTFQRCQAGYKFKPYFEKEAKKRQGTRTDLLSETRENVKPEHTHKNIAELVGVHPETYWYAQSIIDKDYTDKEEYTKEEAEKYNPKYRQLIDLLRNGEKGIEGSYKEIQRWDELIEIEREKNMPKDDREILKELKIEIKPYDVWSIAGLDSRFGITYPGNIPADLVFNTLYFFTNQGDIVLDPMAGGGVVGDVSKVMRRECKMYDINPVRPDIEKWDITKQDLPINDAKLVFWDPPYYKKMEADYGDSSISALSKMKYLEVFSNAAEMFSNKGVEKVALLMSDYDDEYNNRPEENIFINDYIDKFKNTEKWRLIRIIQCPLSTQQIRPSTITNYIENRKLARISRNLIMFGRR